MTISAINRIIAMTKILCIPSVIVCFVEEVNVTAFKTNRIRSNSCNPVYLGGWRIFYMDRSYCSTSHKATEMMVTVKKKETKKREKKQEKGRGKEQRNS